jgi:uncharacterized protein (TIGR02598 family)
VEIVMALGIVGVAFVSLLGMIPVGMNSFTSAIDATVELQIAQGIVADARQAKFTELNKMSASPAYFDDQGKQGGNISANNYVYRAQVQVYASSDILIGVPQSSGTATLATANIATIKVTVDKLSPMADKQVLWAFIANNGL